MTDRSTGYRPSAAARAFLADPANRDQRGASGFDMPTLRAEGRAEADAATPGILAKWGVTLSEIDVLGIPCLEIMPQEARAGVTHLYCFGGGFVVGGPHEDLMLSAPLAAQSRTRVVAPYYSLAPEQPWPNAVADCCRVARALASTGRLVISGESAGGNLALVATQDLMDRGRQPVALGLLSPAADLRDPWDGEEFADDPTLNPAFVEEVHAVYAPGQDMSDARLSPVCGAFGPDWPPTMITTGTRDRLLGPCARLARAIRAGGGTVDMRVWDGLWHVFEYYPDIPEAAQSLAEIAEFLAGHLEGA
ncbi:MAG: alpha/beta hydrolase fold domain-containing protein [Pseudomonadota bacterium]